MLIKINKFKAHKYTMTEKARRLLVRCFHIRREEDLRLFCKKRTFATAYFAAVVEWKMK